MTALLFLRSHWKLIAYTLTAFLCFAAGWKIRGELELADQARAMQRQAERRQQIDEASAAQLAAISKRNRELQRKLRHELANPAYSTCRVPAGGLLLRREAVAGSGQPDTALPADTPAPK